MSTVMYIPVEIALDTDRCALLVYILSRTKLNLHDFVGYAVLNEIDRQMIDVQKPTA